MDLSLFKINKNAVFLPIKNPVTGEDLIGDDGKVPGFMVVSVHDDHYKRVVHKQSNAKLKKMNMSRLSSYKMPTAEEAEADKLEQIVACVVDICNISLDGTNDMVYSRENVLRIFEELPYVRLQVELFVFDEGNFILASSRDLSSGGAQNTGSIVSGQTEPPNENI